MSIPNIQSWLQASQEDNTAPVNTQEGETPNGDFGATASEMASDVETADPATASLDPASKDAPTQKVKEQGSQQTRLSAEGTGDDTPRDETNLKPAEADGDQDVPAADAQVEGDPENTQTANAKGASNPSQEDAAADITPADVKAESDAAQDDEPEDPYPDAVDVTPASDDNDEAIAEVEHRVDEVESHIEHFEKVSGALEAYRDILTAGLDNDGVSSETAAAIRIGIEHLDPHFAQSNIIPSQECFGETMSRRAATVDSLESIDVNTKQIVKAVRNAIAKIFEFLREMWKSMSSGAAGARKNLEHLRGRIDNLSSTTAAGTIQVKGVSNLSVEGAFVGNDIDVVRDLEDVAKFIFEDYPKQAAAFATDIASSFSVSKGSDPMGEMTRMVQDFRKSANRQFGKIPKSTVAAKTYLPAGLANKPRINMGAVLPNDHTLIQYIRESESTDEIDQLKDLLTNTSSVFNMDLVKLENTRKGPESVSYRAPSKGDLLKMADGIDRLLEKVEQAPAKAEGYKKVQKALDGAIAKVSTSDMVLPAIRCASMQSAANMLTRPSKYAVQYLVSVCKMFLAVLKHNVEYHEAQEA